MTRWILPCVTLCMLFIAGRGRPANAASARRPLSTRGIVKAHLDAGRVAIEIPTSLLDHDLLIVGRITSGTTDPQFENVPGLGANHGAIPWTPFANSVIRLTEGPAKTLLAYKSTSADRVKHGQKTDGEVLAEAAISRRTRAGALVVDAEALLQRGKLGFHGKWAVKPDSANFTRADAINDRAELNATTQGKEGPIGLQWSLLWLPPHPMAARHSDPRVNFSANGVNIERWRLVKKNPIAKLSEPVNPIIVYLDPSIPVRWRDQVRRGVMQWDRAFEEAGFHNALIVRDVRAADANWSTFDLRQGITVWWTAGYGGNCWKISDPRSGELLNSVVTLFDDGMADARKEYVLHAGGADASAATWPVPDRILESGVRRLAAHEVGHGLGLDHNFMSQFSTDKLRDSTWTRREGSAPTIMGYNAFNRVAQPDDVGLVDACLSPHVGAFDRFSIHWGYSELPFGLTPQQAQKVLDSWTTAAQQTPWLRYTRQEGTFGDIDPWKHFPKSDAQWPLWANEHLMRTRLYMANVRRINKELTAWKDAEGGQDILFRYRQLWSEPLEGVAEIVSSPVPTSVKREALQLLDEELFSVPPYLYAPEFLKRWDENLVLTLLRSSESELLCKLLDHEHMKRLAAASATSGYSPHDLAADLDHAIWRELNEPKIKVNRQRQMVQRVYLEEVKALVGLSDKKIAQKGLKLPEAATGEVFRVFRAELSELSKRIAGTPDRSADEETRIYLEAMKKDLAEMHLSQ